MPDLIFFRKNMSIIKKHITFFDMSNASNKIMFYYKT